MKSRGLLISFEGLDRSGKSTQAKLLKEYFINNNQQVDIIRFPDRSTFIGNTINQFLTGSKKIQDEVVHLLFAANRWEFKPQIESSIESGMNIIFDRYAYSGVAYTSAKGFDIEWCKNADRGLPRPDLVIFMEIDQNKTSQRENFGDEIYEKKEFQQKVNEQYHRLQENNWHFVNADDTLENISAKIQSIIKNYESKFKSEQLQKLWI